MFCLIFQEEEEKDKEEEFVDDKVSDRKRQRMNNVEMSDRKIVDIDCKYE